MSLFWIKIIAILSMLLDHIGVFFVPESITLRMLGRLAFPLFAWGIANGAHYSKNKNKYLLRLFLMALVSQVPYYLLIKASGGEDVGPNILFTLSLALLMIIFIERFKDIYLKLAVITIGFAISVILRMDYSAFGIFSILVFYYFYNDIQENHGRKPMDVSDSEESSPNQEVLRTGGLTQRELNVDMSFSIRKENPAREGVGGRHKSPLKISIFYIFGLIIYYLLPLVSNNIFTTNFEVSYLNLIQPLSAFSLIPIYFYNGKLGYKAKYLFYIFYPTHLLLLYLIKVYF